MKYLSLFSGIGGFELGIQQAYEELYNIRPNELADSKRPTELHSIKNKFKQWKCVGYSEIDPYAIQIYQKHFKHKNYGDITKIQPKSLPDFEFLVGGFPCQSFSVAGKRGGFSDTRGTMFFEIARIVKEKQPRLLLLENVKGLLSHEQGATFHTIISTLDELGYDLQWQVLNSKNFGVPQNRERVFIIGHLRGTSRPEVFPFGGGDSVDKKTQQTNRQEIQTHRCLEASEYKNYSAERFDGVLQDLQIRRLTPTECERLQGFPDGWTKEGAIHFGPSKLKGVGSYQRRTDIFPISNTQRYKTLGNAVTVNVIREIIKKLL